MPRISKPEQGVYNIRGRWRVQKYGIFFGMYDTKKEALKVAREAWEFREKEKEDARKQSQKD